MAKHEDSDVHVSLKRAAYYAKYLQSLATSLRVEPMIAFSIHTPHELNFATDVQPARTAALDAVMRISKLLQAAFDIRQRLSEANHAYGVNRLLNQRERIKLNMALLARAIEAFKSGHGEDDKEHHYNTARAKIAAMKVRAANPDGLGFNSREEIQIKVIPTGSRDLENMESDLRSLQRTYQQLMEELVSVNVRHTVALPAYIVNLVQEVGLSD
jgi:hypothetical protein